ncbi:MAG: tRNA (adenosine(37)-N6)-threonylcarbamoyltransferase complex ATPase subunit type 1 TsaE [Deltaproteobacteria bacterium]|jgi:tRNA threonylcarbamoyladenosine biosynthesis protein TsaE|nr:tRNA (adenosine(37)-N6)-threonylcarbamoyltransferase complex ATPase subunit type 1 TsaE [Deltaproteobacteria bacterium]
MPDVKLQKFETFESDSPENTELIAAKFAKQLRPSDFIALNGPLGAGKTKFTSGVIRFFCGDTIAASPTYSIMNKYRCGGINVNHFDFYRLKTVYDLENCGFFDSLEGGNLTIAEWTDTVKIDYGKYAEGNYYSINIRIIGSKTNKEKRNIKIEKIL